MSASDLDRRLTTFFDAASDEALPDGLLDEVNTVTRQMPQRKRHAGRPIAAAVSWWTNPFGLGPRLRVLAVTALVLIALVAALTYAVGHARRLPPPFGPAGNGLIVFDIDQRLYLADPDGTAIPLDIALGHNWDATFSPDGTHLAFWSQSAAGAPVSLFVADADGSHARRVSGDMAVNAYKLAAIAWSPDGSWIAFASRPNGKASALYIAAADGSGVRQITRDDDGVDRAYPAWSPRGDLLAFQRSILGDAELAVMAPDGSGERMLLRDDGYFEGSFNAVWSSDGSRLAFGRIVDRVGRVGVVGMNGTEVLMPEANAGAPMWSNDGTRLAYITEDGAGIVRTLATGAERVIPPGFADYGVYWSPDDRMLLGIGRRQGASAYRIPLDHPDAATSLSDAEGDLRWFSWQRVAP